MTFDLGRVTTQTSISQRTVTDCGDVRSRTSYNIFFCVISLLIDIAVTFDLGRVTTWLSIFATSFLLIAVTFDLGRVTTTLNRESNGVPLNCGDVRSRTSYNCVHVDKSLASNCGDVRSRTSYNVITFAKVGLVVDCGDVRSRTSYNPNRNSPT